MPFVFRPVPSFCFFDTFPVTCPNCLLNSLAEPDSISNEESGAGAALTNTVSVAGGEVAEVSRILPGASWGGAEGGSTDRMPIIGSAGAVIFFSSYFATMGSCVRRAKL